PHFDLDCTRSSAARATSALLPPTPQRCWARRSTAISVERASAPCHQPSFAPVTIHAFWYSQCETLRFVFRGCASSHVPSCVARFVSGISSSGSARAPGTANAAGRLCGQVEGFVAVVVRAAGAVVVAG